MGACHVPRYGSPAALDLVVPEGMGGPLGSAIQEAADHRGGSEAGGCHVPPGYVEKPDGGIGGFPYSAADFFVRQLAQEDL